jgi:hypothetical protein
VGLQTLGTGNAPVPPVKPPETKCLAVTYLPRCPEDPGVPQAGSDRTFCPHRSMAAHFWESQTGPSWWLLDGVSAGLCVPHSDCLEDAAACVFLTSCDSAGDDG